MTATGSELLGYEEQRETMRDWFHGNVVEPFDLVPGLRVLDAGCGDGFWTDLLAAEGLDAVGFDGTVQTIEAGRVKYPGLDLVVADYEGSTLPFEPGSFDVAFVRGVPALYGPDLAPMGALAALLLDYADRVLFSMYSDESGRRDETNAGRPYWNFPASRYIGAMVASGCYPGRLKCASGYVLLEVRR